RQAGHVGEEETWPPGGAAGRVDGRHVIGYFAVAIKCEPVANERETVRKIECAEARARIGAAVLLCATRRGDAEKAAQERVQVNGFVTFAAEQGRALKSEFEVVRRPEADLLDMDPRIAGRNHIRLSGRVARVSGIRHQSVAAERSDKEVITHRANDAGEPGNIKRLNSVNLKSIEVLRVVGKSKRTAFGRPEPFILLAERKHVVQELIGDVGFEEPAIVFRCDGAKRNGGLRKYRAAGLWRAIDGIHGAVKRRSQLGGVPRSGRRVLKFTAHVKRESARGGISA